MNILLITIAYPPEIRSISTMTRELAEELVKRSHQVTVLTSWPRYNLSSGTRNKQFKTDTVENGVRVIRIKTLPHHKVNYFLRGFAQVTLPFLFRRAFKKFVQDKIDVVVVYSPHLPLVKVGAEIKKEHGARYLLNIQDIFPQNAIDLGVLKNEMAIKFFERMEAQAYREADAITTCTEGARQFLIYSKGVPEDKVSVVHNWIDIDVYKSALRTGNFRKMYGLEGKFIFLFSGILGPSQGLEFIIEVARQVRDLRDVVFLFVGDGTEKARLQVLVRNYGLSNVQFEPFISPDEYPALLKEADVGLICLGLHSKTPTVPGKFFGFLASALPVLGFLNPESAGHQLVKESGCGYTTLSNDAANAAALVRKMFSQKQTLGEYGQKGEEYVKANFSKQICIDKMEGLIRAI